jgi:hypothetical protein
MIVEHGLYALLCSCVTVQRVGTGEGNCPRCLTDHESELTAARAAVNISIRGHPEVYTFTEPASWGKADVRQLLGLFLDQV